MENFRKVESPDTYFYFLHDPARWNLKDGFWTFGKVRKSKISKDNDPLSYLESLNAVQGLAFIDASRPNPVRTKIFKSSFLIYLFKVRILNPQCWQNSHFEEEYVELSCVKSPEFFAVQKEKDIIFELLEGQTFFKDSKVQKTFLLEMRKPFFTIFINQCFP